jgi:hypothetical protein
MRDRIALCFRFLTLLEQALHLLLAQDLGQLFRLLGPQLIEGAFLPQHLLVVELDGIDRLVLRGLGPFPSADLPQQILPDLLFFNGFARALPAVSLEGSEAKWLR